MPNMTSYIKSFILWLMYVVFAATSFLFVQETLKDYVEGKTNFQESISIKGTSNPEYPVLGQYT